MAILIKGGNVVDSLTDSIVKRDVFIEGGKISKIMPPDEFSERGNGIEILDISDKILLPGLIDMHVHLREPGAQN